MFRAVLFAAWKSSRFVLAPATVLAFAIPVVSVRAAGVPSPEFWEVRAILGSIQGWGLAYPLLAIVLGALMTILILNPDFLGKHVYALSLPVPRWHLVQMRLQAGLVLLLAPVLGVWLGALVATASVTLPPGLYAYPTTLTLRFALALLVAFTACYGLVALPKRIQAYFGYALLAVLGFGVIGALGGLNEHFFEGFVGSLFRSPGPFEVFTGRWMLIDV